MAYRTADHTRWQQMNFVVGIEIKLSNNHNCRGIAKGHFYDICDELAGIYPKDFKFVGWHPFCRCFAVPKLADMDEFLKYQDQLVAGEDVNGYKFSDEVTQMPKQFNEWVKNNKERIASAKSLPYFLTDNPKYSGITPRLGGTLTYSGTKLGRTATKQAYQEYSNSKSTSLTEEQYTDMKVLGNSFNKSILPMTFTEADSGSVNMHYTSKPHSPFFQNCQTCVAVFETRLRGLDIVAKGYSIDNTIQTALGDNTALAFLTVKGKTPTITILKGETDAIVIDKLGKQTKAVGRYHIGVNYKNVKYGHVFTAERFTNGKILYYDPQKNEFLNIRELANIDSFEVLKVDKLLLNHDVIRAIAD